MFRLARIAYPIDFSDRCVATAECVKALAGRFHSEVDLIYVLAPYRPHVAAFDMLSMLPESVESLHEGLKAQMDCFLQKEFSGMRARRFLAEGDPAQAIVQHAHELSADLILMPTRGMGAFRRYVIGSTTAKVLHDADCPVWTGVHLEHAPPARSELRHIVCAVDLGPQSLKALSWAAGLASEFQSKVTLLHVAHDWNCPPGQRARVLDELNRIQIAAGAACETCTETGEPAKTVVALAAALKADLLVIGRSPHDARTGRLRANAYSIISQSPCPVVSV